MEKYVWEGSQSQLSLQNLLERLPEKDKAPQPEVLEQYAQAVTRFHNEGLFVSNWVSAKCSHFFCF